MGRGAGWNIWLDSLTVRQANAFDLLRSLETSGERFDLVVLDPPAFAKRRSSDLAAERGYREIILRGLRLAVPGGLVVACSCSGRVSRAHFDEIVAAAATDSGRQVQILARQGAGRDTPSSPASPRRDTSSAGFQQPSHRRVRARKISPQRAAPLHQSTIPSTQEQCQNARESGE